MYRKLLIATSVLAMAAFSAPAFAESPAQSGSEDSTGQTHINSGTQQNSQNLNSPDMDTTASTAPSDMNSLVTLMGSGSTTAGQIQSMSSVSDVKVVYVNDWADANRQAWDAAMSQNMQPVNDLRAAIAANGALNEKLTAQQVQSGNVVATQINADGSVTVYVDRAS